MLDKYIHTIQLVIILAVGVILILFGHDYVNPLVVFTTMISGLSGIVGARIASNGYSPSSPQNVVDTPPKTTS